MLQTIAGSDSSKRCEFLQLSVVNYLWLEALTHKMPAEGVVESCSVATLP